MINMEGQIPSLSTKEQCLKDLIIKHGYPVEVYNNITTEDGYLLTAFRIPHGRTNKSHSPKPVVMLMHGLLSNSCDFIIPGPKRGLGFVLSDNGYDVWLVNTRGKMGPRRHLKFKSDNDPRYWRYSFHEMGLYDLPAFLDQIEKSTGLRTISYIGYSLGTVLPMVLLSEMPEFNERFNLVISISPITHALELGFAYGLLLTTTRFWVPVLELTGNLQFPPTFISKFVSFLSSHYAKHQNGYFSNAYAEFTYFLHGRTPEQFIKSDIPLLLEYVPDPASAVVLDHMSHCYASGIFQQFDYGCDENFQRYGTLDPPAYDMTNVVSPVAIFCSSGDLVVKPQECHVPVKNCVAIHSIEEPAFSHTDFLYGRYAPKIVYPLMIDHLKKYSQIK